MQHQNNNYFNYKNMYYSNNMAAIIKTKEKNMNIKNNYKINNKEEERINYINKELTNIKNTIIFYKKKVVEIKEILVEKLGVSLNEPVKNYWIAEKTTLGAVLDDVENYFTKIYVTVNTLSAFKDNFFGENYNKIIQTIRHFENKENGYNLLVVKELNTIYCNFLDKISEYLKSIDKFRSKKENIQEKIIKKLKEYAIGGLEFCIKHFNNIGKYTQIMLRIIQSSGLKYGVISEQKNNILTREKNIETNKKENKTNNNNFNYNSEKIVKQSSVINNNFQINSKNNTKDPDIERRINYFKYSNYVNYIREKLDHIDVSIDRNTKKVDFIKRLTKDEVCGSFLNKPIENYCIKGKDTLGAVLDDISGNFKNLYDVVESFKFRLHFRYKDNENFSEKDFDNITHIEEDFENITKMIKTKVEDGYLILVKKEINEINNYIIEFLKGVAYYRFEEKNGNKSNLKYVKDMVDNYTIKILKKIIEHFNNIKIYIKEILKIILNFEKY